MRLNRAIPFIFLAALPAASWGTSATITGSMTWEFGTQTSTFTVSSSPQSFSYTNPSGAVVVESSAYVIAPVGSSAPQGSMAILKAGSIPFNFKTGASSILFSSQFGSRLIPINTNSSLPNDVVIIGSLTSMSSGAFGVGSYNFKNGFNLILTNQFPTGYTFTFNPASNLINGLLDFPSGTGPRTAIISVLGAGITGGGTGMGATSVFFCDGSMTTTSAAPFDVSTASLTVSSGI